MVGIPMLEIMADALYGKDDPTKVLFRGQIQNFQKEDGYYILTLALPFIEKRDISMTQSNDELIIRVGNFKRNIILPHALVGLLATEAKFEEGKLRIEFHQRQEEGEKT